jgi:hypothetical protein
MKNRVLTAVFVLTLLAPILLVASGGDPRTAWSELGRMFSGGMEAHAAFCGTFPMPFGGNHTGTVFPLQDKRLECEHKVIKNYAKLVKCMLTCHRKKADAIYDCKENDVDACDAKCRLNYDTAAAKIIDKGGCPGCLGAPEQALIADNIQSQLDAENDNFYCTP